MVHKKDDHAKKLREFISKAQEQLEEFEQEAQDAYEDVRDNKGSVEEYIRKNPLVVIGGAFVIGYVLGRFHRGRRR